MPAAIVFRTESAALVRGDCLADDLAPVLAEAFGEDARAQLVLMDPPYGIGHASADDAEAGDWDGAEHRLDYAAALARLRPLCHANASAFVFGPVGTFLDARSALPDASGWHPLQDLVWEKMCVAPPSGRANAESQRTFFPDSERILFCEAASDPGLATPERDAERAWRLREEKEHDAKMAPLSSYFARALEASGLTKEQVRSRYRTAFPNQSGAMLSHYFTPHQFQLPTREVYAVLQGIVNAPIDAAAAAPFDPATPPDGLRREWDDLRREWETLRQEWEKLRRPFFAPGGRTPSDLLQFPPVARDARVHACQKPVSLLSYLVEIATRPGDLVVDPFAGSGSTGVAALATGRRVLLVEREPSALALAERRLRDELRAPRLF